MFLTVMFQIFFDRYFQGILFISFCGVNFLYVTDLCITDTCAVIRKMQFRPAARGRALVQYGKIKNGGMVFFGRQRKFT
jgi:hypothetical protein